LLKQKDFELFCV